MITCSQLRAYDPGRLTTKAAETRQHCTELRAVKDAIRKHADGLLRQWPDSTGHRSATALRQYATQLEVEEDRLRGIAPILTEASGGLASAKSILATADATDNLNRYLQADDHGRVGFTADLATLTESERVVQYRNAKALAHLYHEALTAATETDEEAALALSALIGQQPGFPVQPDTGPVRLTDAAIADQLINSHQGEYANCFFLTALAAIAHTNPQFIRDHIVWDPVRKHYTVTLYEPTLLGHSERRVTVDPAKLDPNLMTSGPGQKLSFLSIYEEAYRHTLVGSILNDTAGVPSSAMVSLTGQQPDATVITPASFAEIKATMHNDPPGAVAVATSPGHWPWQDRAEAPEEQRVAPRHAYWVKGFDDQGRIILINAWGPLGGVEDALDYPGEIHLTEEQFRANTMQTAQVVP